MFVAFGQMLSLKRPTGAASGVKGQLEQDLKRATESGVIEVPKELLSSVSEASKEGEEPRKAIMRHVGECLKEPNATRWRRTYAALQLVEELSERGAPELLAETAAGWHFDLVQRLTLLQHFECSTDKRVQSMVRARAAALRSKILPRLEAAEAVPPSGEVRLPAVHCPPAKAEAPAAVVDDNASTCSPEATSSTGSGCGSSCFSHLDDLPSWHHPEAQMILNGIVAVGHRDDTSDEESGDESSRKPVAYRKPVPRNVNQSKRVNSDSNQKAGSLLDL